MKLLVAVGSDSESFGVLHLIGRLKFAATSGVLAHVIERIGSPLLPESGGGVTDGITQFLKLQEAEGNSQLDKAAGILETQNVRLAPALLTGFIANELMKRAESEAADLIAVTSRDEVPLAKIIVGSVTRKLAVKSKSSLLIARGKLSNTGSITAVIATDHSPYCDRCLDLIIKDWPRGITKATILTAYPKQTVKIIGSIMQNVKTDIAAMVERVLTEKNAALQARLEALGVKVQTKVSKLPIVEAIDKTLSESQAELLVIGAQGHGFLDRFGIGSVSFEQVVNGKSSVLLLRAPA